jgi:hypothetical protein
VLVWNGLESGFANGVEGRGGGYYVRDPCSLQRDSVRSMLMIRTVLKLAVCAVWGSKWGKNTSIFLVTWRKKSKNLKYSLSLKGHVIYTGICVR